MDKTILCVRMRGEQKARAQIMSAQKTMVQHG